MIFVLVDPETFNRFADYDGCPDAIPSSSDGTLNDADGDRIMDVDDACPLEPERYNGFQDDDGCPDIPPYSVVILIQTLMEFLTVLINVLQVKETYNQIPRLKTVVQIIVGI